MELEETVRAAFAHYDHDGSDSIDARELRRLVADLGGIMTEYDLRDALRVLDRDRNGVIDQNEFVMWWSSQKEGTTDGIEGMLVQLKEIGCRRFHVDIHAAAWGGADEVIEHMVEAQEELVHEKDGTDYGDMNTPLHYAAYQGRLAACSLLTSKGAKVNAINKAGCTPLFYAAQQSHLAVAKFLLEHGADARMTESQHGWSAVDVATAPAIIDLFRALADKAPAPPGKPVAEAVSSSELQIKWTAPPTRIDDKLPVSSYRVKLLSESAPLFVLTTTTPDTEAKVGSLAANTEYSVMIAAVNMSGVGDFSEPSAPVKTRRASLSTPNMKVVRASEDAIQLEWEGDSRTTNWIVYQSMAMSSRTWTPVYLCDGDTSSTLVTGLESGKAYYFRVKAIDSGGHHAISTPLSALTNRRVSSMFRASLAALEKSKSKENENMPQTSVEESCTSENYPTDATIQEVALEAQEQQHGDSIAAPALGSCAESKTTHSSVRARYCEKGNGSYKNEDEDEYKYYDSSGSDDK